MKDFYYIEDGNASRAILDQLLERSQVEFLTKKIDRDEPETVRRVLSLVCQSVCEVIATLTGVCPIPREAVKVAVNARPLGKITACMKFQGEVTGTIALSLNPGLARALAAGIARCDEADLTDDDVRDGVGEITNQTSGLMRTLLSDCELVTCIDLPETRTDRCAAGESAGFEPCYVLIFEWCAQRFAAQVMLLEPRETRKPS